MKFGIELETISTRSQAELASLFTDNGIVAHDAYHSAQGYRTWQMKSDGSIMTPGMRPSRRRPTAAGTRQEDRDELRPTRNYRYGVEIVSRVLEWNEAGRQEMERAIDIASPHVTVNTSCGFHVHVGANDLTPQTLTRLKQLWTNLEPMIFSYLPPSRRHNNYCRRGIGDAHTGSRYHGLNLTCLPIKGTVEFRAHHGTMNKKKIISWVAFCIALVQYAKGDQPIPEISITQNTTTGDDIIEVTFRNRRFTVTPTGSHFIYNGNPFQTLKDAVLAIVRTLNPDRTRPIADRFINRNVKRAQMENGGMLQACQTLRVDADAQSFLIERYDMAVRTWGLAN